ncbi:alpha/beta hydrolase [Parerythrobacter aurantius]|uniref:alpha/beta hydrolase fold domain-containing protein n=1 Tax=Parerythrobacter aurantius TaxID=3127706 RepID=UPI003248C74A
MASFQSRIAELLLPFLGVKAFFSEPERMPGRLARERARKPARPRAKWHQQFRITEDSSRGYPVVTVAPLEPVASGAPHLLYLHGGGYVLDVSSFHFDAVCSLCQRLGASATIPVYPLAPENKASEILSAMGALYREVAGRHGAEQLVVMGDSAGGGMSLALAQSLKAGGEALPAALVLWSPWLDATATAEGQASIEPQDKLLARSGLVACGEAYAGTLPLTDPRVSPLFGDLAGLPPMAIFAGTRDILVVDARRLAASPEVAGDPRSRYREYPEMQHVWMLLPLPEARRAVSETADFIEQAIAR